MDSQSDVMLQLFRSNICKVAEERRGFYVNALLAHPDHTLNDLILVFRKVPDRRNELTAQIFDHRDLSPDILVSVAQMHPSVANEVQGMLGRIRGTNRHHYKRLQVVLDEHFPGQTQIYISEEDQEEQKTNRHHYWWPHYHFKGRWRKRIMRISIELHKEYHTYFLDTCYRPKSRPCHSSLCIYGGLCCYWKSPKPFPEHEITGIESFGSA